MKKFTNPNWQYMQAKEAWGEASGWPRGQTLPWDSSDCSSHTKLQVSNSSGSLRKWTTPLRPFQNCSTFSGYIIPGLLWFPSSLLTEACFPLWTLLVFPEQLFLGLDYVGQNSEKSVQWRSPCLIFSIFWARRLEVLTPGCPVEITWKLRKNLQAT